MFDFERRTFLRHDPVAQLLRELMTHNECDGIRVGRIQLDSGFLGGGLPILSQCVAVDGLHGLIVHGFILRLVIAEDLVLAPAAHGNATAFAVMERAAEVRAFLTGVCESSAGEHHAKCTRIGASWDACPSRMRLVGVAVVLRGQSYRPAHHVGNELLPVVHRLQVGPKVFNSQPVGIAMLQISVVMPIPIGSSETAYLTV